MALRTTSDTPNPRCSPKPTPLMLFVPPPRGNQHLLRPHPHLPVLG